MNIPNKDNLRTQEIVAIQSECITHVTQIIQDNIKFNQNQQILLLYDQDSTISTILSTAYQTVIKNITQNHNCILVESTKLEDLKVILLKLNPKDCVIMVQTTNFRLSEFRMRMELNNRGIIVIEHSHLNLIQESQIATYIQCLTYDFPRYNAITAKVSPLIKKATKINIISTGNHIVTYEGPFDKIYYNIGEIYQTLGSFYPIGEFFTELVNLENVNGTFMVYAFPSDHHETTIPNKSFEVTVKNGYIISHQGPERFDQIITLIRAENENGKIPIREMGFGLNQFIGKHAPLGYVGSHERQLGFHVSMGLKHGIYRKKIPATLNQRYHIDMFIDVEKIIVETPDETVSIFENGEYISN